MNPIYSMTGFASGNSITAGDIAFTLALKSVNHRFLDLNLRLPSDCDALEAPIRRLIKENIKRGHVDITLHVDRRSRDNAPGMQFNRDLLASYVRIFHEAAALHRMSVEPNLNELLRLPGVLTSETPSPATDAGPPALETSVLGLLPTLLAQINEVRRVEGEALALEMRASMLRLRALAEESTQLRTGAREAHLQRLRTRLAELLTTDGAAEVADHRLLAEAALLAERSDIEEELVRLRTHIDSFLQMLDAGGEVGKRLDFLLQELNREANTMLSKTSGGDPILGLRLTTLGLEIKSEVERVREQVQNLE